MMESGIPDVQIEEIPVLLNKPKHRVVEIVDPPFRRFKASLKEAPLAEDPTSSLPNAIPTFNGFSPSGDVTADLLYVNYGRPQVSLP